jgi:S-adenosylmethionine:tRNA ribosyltransferase-isomerase
MNGFDLEDYDYVLPEDRIAQSGVEPRDSSKLLVARRGSLEFEHRVFRDVLDYLEPGDVMVLNRTRVIPARLEARKPTGGTLEVLLLREHERHVWSAFLKPARRVAVGGVLEFGAGKTSVTATVESVLEDGARMLRFSEDIKPHLPSLGVLPLPPYIKNESVGERYQTVFGNDPGSVAAPTAGLHFTQRLLERIHHAGVGVWPVTLHVGAGTFKPVASSIEDHIMHSEPFVVPRETSEAVTKAKFEGRRVIAVGTTSVRTLETAWKDLPEGGAWLEPGLGESALFIRPPYEFKVVDGLITNFHLPKSTLLMLVAAFAGYDTMRAAYKTALEHEYRFYSLGDAMLIE